MKDQKTLKVLSDGEKLSSMAQSDGWKLARKMILNKILELDTISSLDEKNPDILVKEIGAKQMAVNLLLEFLRDLEGDVQRHRTNAELFKQYKEEEYIMKFE